MAREYYQVTVKPTITASLQHAGAFAQDDVLFNWTKFYIPRGNGRLVGCTVLVRGVDGADQQAPFDLYFAKSDDFSLGTINSPVSIQPNNDLLAAAPVLTSHYMDGLNTMEVANVPTSARITVQGVKEPIGSGTSPTQNYCLWVGGVAQDNTLNFSTAALTDAVIDVSGLSAPTFTTLDGTACNTVFSPGDIIHAYNPVAAASVICGEVASLDANNITFRADGVKQLHGGGVTLYDTPADFAAWQIQNGSGAAGDLEDNAELYNINPITLILTFNMQN